MKLLLVEDDATLRYMIRNSLEVVIGGYEMAEAANGAEGLELWKTFRPDIIVADVEMPVMDGYEMVAKIRERDRLQPIVFASGMEDPSHVMRGYEVGVNNYIKKPYLPEELDAHVRALLRNINLGGRMENNTETYPIGRWKFNAEKASLSDAEGKKRLSDAFGIADPPPALPQHGRDSRPRYNLGDFVARRGLLLCLSPLGCLYHEAT